MMEFQNKAEMIEHICRTSNTSLEDVYDKISEFGIRQLYTSDCYKDLLNDSYLMLSVYQALDKPNQHLFGLDNRLGKFQTLPYVFYDYFKTKQQYMKNKLPNLEKEIETSDKNLSAQSAKLFQQRMANGENLAKESDLSIKQQEIETKRFKLYSFHKPIDERPDKNIEGFVIADNDLNKALERYKQQRYASLKEIKTDLRIDLEDTNKKLYIQAFQTIRHEGIEVSKALLKWIVAPNHLHRGYLYNLDQKLANRLNEVDNTTIRDQVIEKLNELRNTGAKIWVKIKLVDYILNCQKNAEEVLINGFHLKIQQEEENKLKSIASDAIHQRIEKIARRRSNKNNAHNFEDIKETLTTYYNNQDSTYKQVKEKAGVNVGSSTYSEWKRELDEELK